ncbi:MAG TPA: hypothetical protein PLQ11_00025 [Beijerinckiaceae bacterium]|nr:hypothetical protein [Beijerinckiaceae bacterium]
MSFVTEGRTGIRSEISGFVVHEDQSLEARLRRVYSSARQAAGDRLAKAQDATAAPATRLSPLWERAGALGAAASDLASAKLNRSAKIISSALQAIAHRCLDRSRLFTRLKDSGALVWLVVKVVSRLLWRVPRAVKLIGLTLIAVSAAMLWSDEKDGPSPAQAVAMKPAEVEEARPRPDAWKAVASPIASYHLEAPELDRSTLAYRARTHRDGPRQDILAWTAQADSTGRSRARMSGTLFVESYGRLRPERETLFIDLSRRAALTGASIERLGTTIGLKTKFGALETAEIALSSDGRAARGCLAFRHSTSEAVLDLHGWFCGTADRPVDRAELACLIDRIDLVRAGNDTRLKSYFAEVERARQPCGAARLVTIASNWMDGDDAPVLKAGFSSMAGLR